MFIKIDDIPLGDLPSEQEEWVESMIGFNHFVAITDGDWSQVVCIDCCVIPLEVIVEQYPQEYIVCDNTSEEAEQLRRLGYEEFRGFYTGQRVFRKTE